MNLEKLKNKIVEIFYKDKIISAFVKDIKGKRLHLILPSGKEELINYQSLVSFSEKSVNLKDLNSIISFLKEKNEKREKLKDLFNLEELWEVIVDETEEISPITLAELALGKKVNDDEIAGLIRKIKEINLYFKLKNPEKISILSKKEVKNLLHQRKKELEKLKKLNEGKTFVEALQTGSVEGFSEEIKNFWLEALKEFILWEDQTQKGKLAKEVLEKLNIKNSLKVFKLLVKTGYLKEDENLELLRTKYPSDFSEKENKQTQEILNIEIANQKYIDLTHLHTFTVDAEETQDFDDALSIEETDKEFILYVHITEISNFVKPGSPLWEGALERACTLYLPDKTYPMFPFSLSHKKFSLVKGEIRPAITFKIIFNKNKELLSFEPFLSFIKVKERLTYETVDKLIPEDAFWRKLYEFFDYLKKKRTEKGAFAVFLPEIQIKVDENGEISLQKIELTPARELIAEAMILVNSLTAEYFYKNKIPAIYRSQPQPLEIIEERENSLFFKLLQLKYLAKSELSTKPAFHSGLGVDFYTTLTSPIRRFLDLVMQYQLKSFLENKKVLSEETLLKILSDLILNLQRANLIQNKRHKYFLLKYFQKYLKDKILNGLVLEIHNKKAKIYLPDYNITGDMMIYKTTLNPGEEIQVKIEKVNPFLEILRLKLA